MNKVQWDYLQGRRFELRLKVLMNRLYQQERQARLERREGVVKALSIIAGATVFTSLAEANLVRVMALIIFIGNTCSLVFGWGNKARDALRRSMEWSALETDIEVFGERHLDEVTLNNFFSRCCVIESGEPAANKTLLEMCFLRANAALGGATTESKRSTYWPIISIP